jgi:hypothetical protein
MRTISNAPGFFRGPARLAVSGSGTLRPIQEVFGNDLARGVFAPAAATSDGQLALHFEQRARAVIDGIANLTVTYCVADANVHVSPSSIPRPPQRPLMAQILLLIRMIVNCIRLPAEPYSGSRARPCP